MVSRHLPSLRLLLATGAAALLASLSLVVSTPASISVDGQRVVSDVAPVTTLGASYLPLRVVAEAAGAQAGFDPASGAVVVHRGADVLTLHPGSRRAVLNGRTFTLAHAPFTVRGRTMIADATVTHTFGSSVRYDAKHARVEVRNPGVVVAPVADDEP